MILHINNSLRDAAHTGSHITDHTIADGKDVEHDVHAVTHQGFGCHKANKVMHSSLRAFEFMEVGGVFEQRYGKEQHDQRIADADHRIVQALHYAPYCATLKSLGTGSHQPPKLCQFAVPSGKGIVQIFYDPVLIQGFTFFRIKEMTALLKSKTVAVFFPPSHIMRLGAMGKCRV